MRVKKKVFFKIHSWIGIRLSILFFIVCFSGTLATLSHEMDWLFIPESRAVPSATYASRNLIASNFQELYPNGTIEYWARSKEPYLCDVIYKLEDEQRSYVFANPYTGKIQGSVQITFARFFRDLHYYLFIPFQIGHFTVLIFGFLLLISLLTALFFYKKWWRKLFELQTGKGPLVFFRSLHRLVGLWSVPFSILFSITGIWYFLERTNTANISEISNPRGPETFLSEFQIDSLGPLNPNLLDYDLATSLAEEAVPGMLAGSLVPPSNYGGFIYVTGTGAVPLVRERANRVWVDPGSYNVVAVQDARQIPTVMFINDIADPLHFGNWGGLVTKVIWFVFGLGISSLVLSGIWITAKRKALKRKKENKKIMGVWWHVNWGIYIILMIFMYIILVTRYQVSLLSLISISTGWGIFLFFTWYIFVYRLKQAVSRG